MAGVSPVLHVGGWLMMGCRQAASLEHVPSLMWDLYLARPA